VCWWRAFVVVVAVAVGVGGCAGERWVYEKKSATPAQIDRDAFVCRKESTSAQRIGVTPEQRVDRAAFNRCMERRGYTPRRLE
jgi:hypothetical protein